MLLAAVQWGYWWVQRTSMSYSTIWSKDIFNVILSQQVPPRGCLQFHLERLCLEKRLRWQSYSTLCSCSTEREPSGRNKFYLSLAVTEAQKLLYKKSQDRLYKWNKQSNLLNIYSFPLHLYLATVTKRGNCCKYSVPLTWLQGAWSYLNPYNCRPLGIKAKLQKICHKCLFQMIIPLFSSPCCTLNKWILVCIMYSSGSEP